MPTTTQWARQKIAALIKKGRTMAREEIKRGLLKCVAYDPAVHGESEFDVEPGDDWYVFADGMDE